MTAPSSNWWPQVIARTDHGLGTQQQQQHRLAHNVPRLLQQVALPGGGQLVRPVGGQPPGRVLRGQARQRQGLGVTVMTRCPYPRR
jgi:hypothetical protein